MKNEYIPFISEIKEVIKHTDIEYTFRMTYEGGVKPGQFFEVVWRSSNLSKWNRKRNSRFNHKKSW